MQPIVHGLEEEFSERVTFVWVDAATEEGQAQLRVYGLRGHPSYLLLTASDDVAWSMTGQISAARLREQLTELGGE